MFKTENYIKNIVSILKHFNKYFFLFMFQVR